MPFGSSTCLDKLQEQLQNVILSTRVLKRDHLCRTVMGKQWSWDLLIRDRNKDMEVPNVHPFYSPDMEPLLWALRTASSVSLDKSHCCVCLEHKHKVWGYQRQ